MGLFDGIDEAQAERIRRELGRELRKQLTEELRASLRASVEEEIRKEARRDYEAELAARAPSPDDREAFQALVKEIQLDAYAQAHIASSVADEAEGALGRSRRVASPAANALTIATPLVLMVIASVAEGFGFAFYALAITFALLLLTLVVTNLRRHLRLESVMKRERKTASDFLVVAERAKAYRMVHAERLDSAEELAELLEQLRRDKERLDARHHVSANTLERTREAVRYRVEDLGELPRRSVPFAEIEEEDPAARRRAR
jgi:hypothetical protein